MTPLLICGGIFNLWGHKYQNSAKVTLVVQKMDEDVNDHLSEHLKKKIEIRQNMFNENLERTRKDIDQAHSALVRIASNPAFTRIELSIVDSCMLMLKEKLEKI